MNQTAVSSDTRLSRIAGPVCITRVAMRPAKSFWKNAHDCRETCQWFCQRMRLDTFAAMAWFIRRCWLVEASGRNTSSTPAMPSSHGQAVARSSSGLLAVTSVTTLPMKTGIITSISATAKPTANRPMNSGFAWRAKCQ